MPGFSYAQYRHRIKMYVNNLPEPGKSIAKDLEKLAAKVDLARSEPAIWGYLAVIAVLSLLVLGAGFLNLEVMNWIFLSGAFLAAFSIGTLVYRKVKVKSQIDYAKALEALKAALESSDYHDWWQNKMPGYDPETYNIINGVMGKE